MSYSKYNVIIISGAENGFRPRVTSLMRFMIISYLRHVTDYVHLVLIHFQKLKIWKSKKKPKNTINIFTIYPFFSYDQPKPNPRDPGKWFGIDQITSSPLIIVAPKALKKSLSPRISLLRFSSLRVHCLIEVTWLPYVQFALMSRDKSASKQKYIKQNYRIFVFILPSFF